MSNSEVFYTELHKYIQKIAAQTVDYMVGTPIVSGIVSQSLGSYYKVQLSGGDADATVKAVTINNAHFVIDDAVYLIKAGNSVDNAYYIIGKTQAIEEDFFNLSLDERFNETSTLEVKLGADLKAEDVEALKANGGFQISANFTCNSTTENNYGLKIEFKKGDAIVNTYYLDTHYFRGQPFKMTGLTQMRTIQLDSDMLESGFNNVSIKFFNEDNISATCENIKLAIGYLLNVDGIINVGIAAKNKKNYFNKKQTDVDNNVRLEAEITYNNEKFAAFGIQYYWFVKKDKCVGGKSYLSLAGAGWACLNNFEEVDTVAAPTEKIRLWDNKNNFITLDTTKKLSIIDEKGEKEIEAFSEYKNIVKCIIKYQSTIVESDEFVVYNYAKEKFGALISSNVQPLYLLTSSDEIELTCSIMDENPKTDLSKYEFSYQWYLDSECAEEEIEGANGKTLIVAVGQRGQKDKYDKDDKKYYQSSATKTYYCKVTISLNGNTVSDGEKASVTVQSKIAEGIQIGEEIRYKYYISANQYVTFKKDIESKEEEGLDWNGDWVIIDDSTQHEKIWISETGNSVVGITPVVKYGVFIGSSGPQPYSSENLTMPDKQQFNRIKAYGTEKEGSYYYWNGRWNSGGNTYDRWLAHKNKNNFDYILTNLKTKEGALVIDNVKPIIDFDVLLQMELANSENLYYTSQRVLYEMVGALRNDLRVDNWVMPTLLRSRSENGQELSENTINKMSSYSQLTNGGEKQGVYQQDVYYKLSDEEINQGPQSGKVYCTLDAETGKYTQVDVSEGFEPHTDYYEFCPAKLFINAEYIQTGTLKVASSDGTNQKFFASIDETQVEIGGFNVGDTTLVGKDGDVGIGSQASGGNAFWAGPIVLPTAAPKIVYTELDFDTTGADSQVDAAQNDFHSIVYQDGEYRWYLRGGGNPDEIAEDGHDLGQYFKLVGYEFFKGEQLCKWEAICDLKYTSGSPWGVKYILTEDIFDNNNYPFHVTHEGELFATKANIQGNITATSGKIGGCTIDTDGSITSSNGNFKVDGSSGNLAARNASIAGAITAKEGIIGGFNIDASSLTGEQVGLASVGNDNDNAFWAGAEDQNKSHPFYVTQGGFLKATSADISGTITANQGSVGDWEIGKEGLMNKEHDIGLLCSPTIKYPSLLNPKNDSPVCFYSGGTLTQLTADKLNQKSTSATILIEVGDVAGTCPDIKIEGLDGGSIANIKDVTSAVLLNNTGSFTTSIILIKTSTYGQVIIEEEPQYVGEIKFKYTAEEIIAPPIGSLVITDIQAMSMNEQIKSITCSYLGDWSFQIRIAATQPDTSYSLKYQISYQYSFDYVFSTELTLASITHDSATVGLKILNAAPRTGDYRFTIQYDIIYKRPAFFVLADGSLYTSSLSIRNMTVEQLTANVGHYSLSNSGIVLFSSGLYGGLNNDLTQTYESLCSVSPFPIMFFGGSTGREEQIKSSPFKLLTDGSLYIPALCAGTSAPSIVSSDDLESTTEVPNSVLITSDKIILTARLQNTNWRLEIDAQGIRRYKNGSLISTNGSSSSDWIGDFS